jgi:YidC/Oxa1 family membrane protein insertase
MFGVLAQLLNWCYTLWPNYLGMVLLFTLILMVLITPFTVKGMRSAAEMARLQPEIKKLQDQYKNDRIKQNEEMQALFKEHGVNPLGGCLPTLLPLPIFFIVFRLLERLNGHRTGVFAPLVRLVRGQVAGSGGYVAPHYLSYSAKLTQSIIKGGGHLKAFGMDLSQTARAHHSSVGQALPYYILIVVMTASQYWQQRQINRRNPAAANANPQMKMTMQLFPFFYAVISLNIPATVVFYLLISGLFRMAQNYISYTYDPVLKRAAVPIGTGGSDGGGGSPAIEAKSRAKAPVPAAAAPSSKAALGSGRTGSKATAAPPPAKQGGFMERLRAQAAEAKAQTERAQQEKSTKGQADAKEAKPSSDRANGRPARSTPGGAGLSGPSGSGRSTSRKSAPGGAGLPDSGESPQTDGAGLTGKAAPPGEDDAPVADEPAVAGSGSGNGSGQPRRSSTGPSPLKVTRPSGRITPPNPPKGQPGRRPKKGQ